MDKGTENTLIAQSQIAFRLHGIDTLSGIKSVRTGSSPTNSVCESCHALSYEVNLFASITCYT